MKNTANIMIILLKLGLKVMGIKEFMKQVVYDVNDQKLKLI